MCIVTAVFTTKTLVVGRPCFLLTSGFLFPRFCDALRFIGPLQNVYKSRFSKSAAPYDSLPLDNCPGTLMLCLNQKGNGSPKKS